jgi:hypothetical protein
MALNRHIIRKSFTLTEIGIHQAYLHMKFVVFTEEKTETVIFWVSIPCSL